MLLKYGLDENVNIEAYKAQTKVAGMITYSSEDEAIDGSVCWSESESETH